MILNFTLMIIRPTKRSRRRLTKYAIIILVMTLKRDMRNILRCVIGRKVDGINGNANSMGGIA